MTGRPGSGGPPPDGLGRDAGSDTGGRCPPCGRVPDRAPSGRTLSVEIFGAAFPLPLSPFLLAYACEAELLPAFVVQEGWWRSRSEIGAPVRFPRTQDREADLQAELDALFTTQNASPTEDVTSIPATFLRVTVAV